MKALVCCLIVVCAVCGSMAFGQGLKGTIDYPVPALPADGWIPAWVTLKNPNLAPIKCSIVTSEYYYYGRTTTSFISEKVLAPSQQWRGTVYVYATHGYGNDSSPVMIKFDEQRINTGSLRIGRSVLALTSKLGTVTGRTEQLDAMLKLGDTDPSGRNDLQIQEYKDASTLPDSWMGYSRLQLMVIEDFPYAALSRAQEDAIVQWVEKGGTIIVCPGKLGMVFQSSLLRQLADFRCDGSETLDRSPADLGSPEITSRITRWNVEVDGAEHLAWAEKARCGRGKVIIAKYDVLGPTFAEWKGTGGLFRSCEVTSRPSIGMPMGVGWEQKEEKTLKPPAVAAILGVYLMAVGPVNYVFLRRRKKLVLMPLTIAAISLAFTFAIIGFGYLWKGFSNELKELSIINTLPDRTTAYASSQIGFYCSSNRSFELEFPNSTGLRKVGEGPESRGGGRDESPLTVVDRGDGLYRAQFTPLMWTTFRFEAYAPLPQFGNLRAEKQGGNTVIVNATSVDLKDVWYRTQTGNVHQWYNIGSLPKGGRAAVSQAGGPAPPDVAALTTDDSGSFVVGKASLPAIPYTITTGYAQKKQSTTYVTGGSATGETR